MSDKRPLLLVRETPFYDQEKDVPATPDVRRASRLEAAALVSEAGTPNTYEQLVRIVAMGYLRGYLFAMEGTADRLNEGRSDAIW